jgi:hypothetical protein
MSIMTPGANFGTPNTVTLFTAGPFTVTGSCYVNGSGRTLAETYVTTSQDHAAISDYEGSSSADFNVASGINYIGNSASSLPGTPAFRGPDDGTAAFTSADGQITVNLATNVGTYVGSGGGATVPACTFSGVYTKY